MKQAKNILFSRFMQAAFLRAEKAFAVDEVPVGAVIVDPETNKIISRAHNLTKKKKDPTAHAEMLAIKMACKKIGAERLGGFDMYVTLEPCQMCAQAISFARIRRLYFSADDEKGGGVVNGAKIYNSTSCHHKPEVYSGIMAEESSRLLKNFFSRKRN